MSELSGSHDDWVNTGQIAIGGLTEIGFGAESDYLLVVSSQGRGVFDCLSGERISRDYDSPDYGDGWWYDPDELVAYGIGPLEGELVSVVGLHGGVLPTVTSDGWSLRGRLITPPRYSEVVLLAPGELADSARSGVRIVADYEIRAFGFSPTERSLAVALSSDVFLYARAVHS